MFVGDNFVGISAEEEKTLATVRYVNTLLWIMLKEISHG